MTQTAAKLLRDPAAYPQPPARVEVCQTHISLVFLTDDRAYKLKKPVKFDFLDFSTPELRRQACEDEVRLNRRLAPEVYLGVESINRNDQGELSLSGTGEPVDWVVVMQRLDHDATLEAKLETDAATSDHAAALADRLLAFYRSLPPVELPVGEYEREIDDHIRGNRSVLLESPQHFADEAVKRIHGAQLAFLHTRAGLFEQRVAEGRIVEGHGDLRPEHVYLFDPPAAIDCIEFNREFRELDVLDELSFLAMECTRLAAGWFGDAVIDRYLDSGHDDPPSGLREFYMSYRACVRAKVSVLRAEQLEGGARGKTLDEAANYLRLADEAAKALGDPLFVVVRGLAGVGKSTIAAALAERLGAEHLQTDAFRQRILGDKGASPAERYSEENRRRVYEELLKEAEALAAARRGVVVDGTFLTTRLQQAAADAASRTGARFVLVNCHCPPETAAARIRRRAAEGGSLSEADVAVHQQQIAEQQPPPASLPQCAVDTTAPLEDNLSLIVGALGSSQ